MWIGGEGREAKFSQGGEKESDRGGIRKGWGAVGEKGTELGGW